MDLKALIREIPDFPKPGISYKDITTLLANPVGLKTTVQQMAEPYRARVDLVIGIESRGFILGSAIACELGTGLALVRKPGKLPAETHSASYELEYGSDALEIHRDAFAHGTRVLLVDDLLATGGTAAAAIELVGHLGAEIVGATFVIELSFLPGRKRLAPVDVHALIDYPGE